MNFDRLFGHLEIGRAPTALRSRYFILQWDFSYIESVVVTVQRQLRS